MAILALLAVGYWVGIGRRGAPPAADPQPDGVRDGSGAGAASGSTYSSLVVLPLENTSGDPAQEWFADGMTETLITELAKVRDLKVISRTSAMHYKDSDLTLRQIAAELGVDAVVEGSALQVGDRVRITAQLIDAATDHHLWADDYDGDLGDVLSLHREVARTIAREVQATLSPVELRRLGEAPSANPDATVAYLQGLDHYHQLDFGEAERLARRAIEVDPGFAPGYELLGTSLQTMWDFGGATRAEAIPEARRALDRALTLDPDRARARAQLGFSLMAVDQEWEAAERQLRRAYEMDPSTGWAYAFWLAARGRPTDAIEAAHRTVERDPANALHMADLAQIYALAGRHEDQIEWLRSALEIDPDSGYAHFFLYWAYHQAGRPEEAFPAFLEMTRLVPSQSDSPTNAATVSLYEAEYERGGWPAVWRAHIRLLDGRVDTRSISARLRAHLALGQASEALDELEALEEVGDPWLIQLTDPMYDSLREEPRFRSLLQRLDYPQRMWR